MANQTVTTVVNYDSAAIAGLLDGEQITINATGQLTINSDVRWNQQAAVFGNIIVNSVGRLFIDGTTVWEVPFDTPTGLTPVQNAIGANGVTGGTSGATGELLRVFQYGTPPTPVAAGAAMPATGFIKLRSKNGNFQAGEVITLPGGTTVVVTGAGQRSWLQLVGAELTTLNMTAVANYNSLVIDGDWYELGTTNGADDQTFQFPVADTCPAIWIETAAGSGVYECWLNAGARWGTATQYIPTADKRGMFFGIDVATGVITIARRATNACGYKPPSGCKVRIGNLILSNSNSTNWAANTISATATTNYRFSNGIPNCPVTISKATVNWSLTFSPANSNPQYAWNITDCGVSIQMSLCGNLTRVGVGIALAIDAASPIQSRIGNINLTDFRHASYSAGFNNGMRFTSSFSINMERVRIDCFGQGAATTRTNSIYATIFNACQNITINDITCIGAALFFSSCNSVRVTNYKYADLILGTTSTSGGVSALATSTNCVDVYFEGFSNYENLTNVHPRNSIASFSSTKDLQMVNIGTPSTPYNGGTVNAMTSVLALNFTENTLIRRVYVDNSTAFVISGGLISKTTEFINFWGSGGGSITNNFTAGVISKGNRWTFSSATYDWFFEDGFSSTTVGRINAIFSAYQGTAITSGQYYMSGNYLQNIGDYIELTMDYFALGHTGFSSVSAMPAGVNVQFQYDVGSGWNGTWLSATTANATAIGAINPATGIKLKVKAIATAANSTAGTVTFATTTNSTAYQTQYPLPVPTYTGAITNIISGSWMQIYNETQNNEIYNAVINATDYTTTFSLGGDYNNGDIIRVRLTYTNGVTAKLGFEARAEVNNGWAIFADQVDDVVYNAIGLDGSTITEFSADYPNIQIDLNDPDYQTTVHRLYAWWVYNLSSNDGIYYWFGGLVAEDIANFKVITSILNLQLDNVASTAVNFTGGIRLYRDDGSSPVVTATTGGGSIILYADKVYVVNDPTPTEIADTILRRSTANVEASTTGDPLTLKSLYGMVAQGVHNTQVSGATLTVTKSDDTTTLGTRTVTTNGEALPIIGIDSD